MEQKNDEDLINYYQHLEALHSDFKKRFEDILKFTMNIPEWVSDSFSNTETIDSPILEDELIEATTNEKLESSSRKISSVLAIRADTYTLS